MSGRDRLWITGPATWLPGTVETVVDAVGRRRVTVQEAEGMRYAQLPVEHCLAAPEMAARAARVALDRAGLRAADVGLLAYAWTYHQGHEFWSPAHYVANEIGAAAAVPVGVQQMCNGAAAALELAASRLRTDPALTAALVATGDRFCGPGFDRWQGDYAVWYGDGATAAVLGRTPTGPDALELTGMVTVAAPQLESMHRGGRAFSRASSGEAVDVRRRKKEFLSGAGKDAFVGTVQEKVREVLGRGMAAAALRGDDPGLRCVVLPRLGHGGLETVYRPAVTDVTDAPALDFGGSTGHLGAGDLVANLAELSRAELLGPGESAVLLSAGAGFTWSCVVVRRESNRHEG